MYQKNCTTSLGGAYNGGAPKEELACVETDPSGRYGRFREVLGKGAMKTVYKAFDEVLGMEVAWNQVKLNDVFKSPEALQRLYSEVHLLKNLDHESIIQYWTSWIDLGRRTFNFITEMFTSGTLREYRAKYQKVDIRAIKRWARQILNGLTYLHSHDPPIIHRDLKCDNIFVNGHLGEVKIGDLGLAAVLRGSQHAHSVIGTPEFMAPELYEEDYNELVDVYSFGMCVLEMLTSEYPYSECSNPAQIYKKVTSGKLPEAFYRIESAEAQRFVGRCLEKFSKRPSAKELLLDPFLVTDESDLLLVSRATPIQNLAPNGTVVEQLPHLADDSTKTTDMLITGTMKPGDDTVFLQVQILDEDGLVRNIHFPFNVVSDTSINVALEMVKELEITDWEPLEIAEMIEEEISSLVPNWRQHSSSQPRNCHCFGYEDDGDEYDGDKRSHHFYAGSSCSSSQDSPLATPAHQFPAFGKHAAFNHNWLQENRSSSGGSSSNSSLNSLTYLNMNCYSGNDEEDCDPSPPKGKEVADSPRNAKKTQGITRFCPENSNDHHNHRRRPKLHRIRSLVDMRTQVLHRSLMELINKRREFKTVGSLQNVTELRDPSDLFDRVSLRGDSSRGRCFRP